MVRRVDSYLRQPKGVCVVTYTHMRMYDGDHWFVIRSPWYSKVAFWLLCTSKNRTINEQNDVELGLKLYGVFEVFSSRSVKV